MEDWMDKIMADLPPATLHLPVKHKAELFGVSLFGSVLGLILVNHLEKLLVYTFCLIGVVFWNCSLFLALFGRWMSKW